MAKEIKFLGFTLRKGEVSLKANNTSNAPVKNRRASQAIKALPKREVSFQIADIKVGLTLAKNTENPDRSKILDIYDYIKRDGHLKSQIKLAILKVLSEPWMLFDGDKPNEELSKSIRKRWFNQIIKYILEAEMYGYSLVELDKIDPKTFTIGEVKSIDRQFVSIERQHILIDGTINGSFLPYADIMQEIDLLEFGERNDLGCLLECSYNVIWKFYSRSDWSRGSEKVGMPILLIEADTNNDTELDNLESKAASFGADGYMVMQKGDKATLLERKGDRMHDVWLDNMTYCDDQVSKIINGQTGSSDNQAFVGTAQVQERTMDDFTNARLQNIVDEVNEKVLPYLRAKGFAIAETTTLDYPSLIRERERKLNGPIVNTDPTTPPIEKPQPKK